MIVWKHIENPPYSDRGVGILGKIRIFSIHYEFGLIRGEEGHYALVPKIPGFKKESYKGKTLEELKELAERMLSDWLEATGLQVKGERHE